MMNFLKIFFVLIFFLPGQSFGDDVQFTSDNIKVDEKNKIVTALGNVIIINNSRKIQAEKVTYDQNLDKAIATGNVILTEKDGSIYETDKAILTNEFKSVIAIPLFGKLADKSNVSAKKFDKNDLGESFFREGVYTACECDLKKGETPIWRLETKQIKHDPKTKTVYLKNPVMKIFSLPVYYLPYLSFPDWTIKRRSGFLTTTYGYSKRNRFHLKVPYYFAPENDPTWDMTFITHQNGKTGHADQLNIRKEYEETSLETNIYKGNFLNTFFKYFKLRLAIFIGIFLILIPIILSYFDLNLFEYSKNIIFLGLTSLIGINVIANSFFVSLLEIGEKDIQ